MSAFVKGMEILQRKGPFYRADIQTTKAPSVYVILLWYLLYIVHEFLDIVNLLFLTCRTLTVYLNNLN